MSRRSTVAAVCLAGAALLAAGPQLAQAGKGGGHGKLKVKPKDVMVTQSVQVKGMGFARRAAVTLRECGRTFWIVPEEPCNTGNEVTVHTRPLPALEEATAPTAESYSRTVPVAPPMLPARSESHTTLAAAPSSPLVAVAPHRSDPESGPVSASSTAPQVSSPPDGFFFSLAISVS